MTKGSGKNYTYQILTALLDPTSSYALNDGYHLLKNAKKVKSNITLMLESEMFYYRLTANDNLKFLSLLINRKLHGIEDWFD